MIIKSKKYDYTIIEMLLLMFFLIYPLYLFSAQALNVSTKILALILLFIGICMIEILMIFRKQIYFSKKIYRLDVLIVIILLNAVFQLFVTLEVDKIEYYILASISALMYFTVSIIEKYSDKIISKYINCLLISASIVCTVILIKYLIMPSLLEPIQLLVKDTESMISFLLLIASSATIQYCSNNKKQKDRFYLPLAGIGYFLLFLQKDSISILLCGMLFLVIPMIYSPTAELIKRNLILCFLYFFILSNMPLLTNYTNLLQIEVSFELTNSIYLDLAIAIAGVFVFQYWERVPKDIPLNRIIMHKFQRAIQFIFKVVCILLAVILCTGNLDTLPEKFGISMLKNIGSAIRTGIAQSSGTFQQTLEGYGIIGFILIIILFSMIITKLRKNYRPDNKTAMLTIITILFMVQSLFYRQQSVTTPIYVILVTFAIFNEKPKEESHETTKQYTKERFTDDKKVEYISSNSNGTVTS